MDDRQKLCRDRRTQPIRDPNKCITIDTVPILRNLRVTLEMIKWEHSIFALPFALCGAMLAAGGFPSLRQLVWIVVAMVAARSAAMAFNRWADASIDAANPRTATRALPAGHLSPAFVATFVVVSSAIFIFAASQLNRLALMLSPVALAVLLLYSYTKRVTRWSHLVLGFALGIAPAAAWIAVRGSLDPRILLLTAAVTFWVAGFDVLYACQDYDFDREAGLHSIPAMSAFAPRSGLLAHFTSSWWDCWLRYCWSSDWASWQLRACSPLFFCCSTSIRW
jgi:4-hydroxybenzoate polyprenyltransferase